jgi:hypothetical protein
MLGIESIKQKSCLHVQQVAGKIQNVQLINHQNDKIHVKHSTLSKNQTEQVPK